MGWGSRMRERGTVIRMAVGGAIKIINANNFYNFSLSFLLPVIFFILIHFL